jgi:hypothetical protein
MTKITIITKVLVAQLICLNCAQKNIFWSFSAVPNKNQAVK